MPEATTEFKPQPTFFPDAKRKLVLEDVGFKFNAESEKRIRLDFGMPLTHENVLGMPGVIGGPFASLCMDDAIEGRHTLPSLELEGLTCEFFATDKSPRRTLLLAASTLRAFYLERDDKGEVTLHFNTTVIRNSDLAVWAHENQGATLWAVFTATQPALKAPPNGQMKLGEEPEPDNHPTMPEEQKKAVAEIPPTRTQKEKAAKAAGKPRGFHKPLKKGRK